MKTFVNVLFYLTLFFFLFALTFGVIGVQIGELSIGRFFLMMINSSCALLSTLVAKNIWCDNY